MSHEVTRSYGTERGEELYTKDNELLGIFPTVEAANEYARRRSNPELYPTPRVPTPDILRDRINLNPKDAFDSFLQGRVFPEHTLGTVPLGNRIGEFLTFLRDTIKTIPQPTYGERKARTVGEKVGKEIGDIADIALVFPALFGMVRTGERIGPKRYQKILEWLEKRKQSLPVTDYGETPPKISEIGAGAEGTSYRVGDVVAKIIQGSRGFEEPLASYRLRGQPSLKRFLGTVSEAQKDIPELSKYSEATSSINRGEVSPRDLRLLAFFSQFEPDIQRITKKRIGPPSITSIKNLVSSALRSGVVPMDVHTYNLQYRETPTGLSSPVLVDLGLSRIFKKPRARYLGATESGLLDEILGSIAEVTKPFSEQYPAQKESVEAMKKLLITYQLARDVLGKKKVKLSELQKYREQLSSKLKALSR